MNRPPDGADSFAAAGFDPQGDRMALQDILSRIQEIRAGIIYILDPDGRFTFLNNAVEDILHYSPNELLGKHFSTIMSTEEFHRVGRQHVLQNFQGKVTGAENAPQLFDERRSGPRRTRNIEIRLLAKGGQEVRVLKGDVAGIMGSEGYYEQAGEANAEKTVFLGSQGVIFDITDYKEAEEHRKRFERHIQEVRKYDAIGRLAGGVAHNFNNKMSAVLGYAELLKQKSLSCQPEFVKLVEPIIQAVESSAELTSQLLAFARQGASQNTLINVNEIVLSVAQLLSSAVSDSIAVKQHLTATCPLVKGDPSQIRSALLNVALNGCDAMPEGGELLFETRVVDAHGDGNEESGRTGEQVQLTVVDYGRGMDEETKSRIFEPFFTTKRFGEGAGMGLAGVYGCVQNHGGRIEVMSALGKGTRFTISLPFVGAKAEAGAEGKQNVDSSELRGMGGVLLIDDNDDIRHTVGGMLEEAGYRVTLCSEGNEALRLLRERSLPVDCVLLDMVMPGMDGGECFRQVKAVRPELPVILVSSYNVSGEVEKLLREGAADFMPKPLSYTRLTDSIARVLRARCEQ